MTDKKLISQTHLVTRKTAHSPDSACLWQTLLFIALTSRKARLRIIFRTSVDAFTGKE